LVGGSDVAEIRDVGFLDENDIPFLARDVVDEIQMGVR
jgi:hypothetical protein